MRCPSPRFVWPTGKIIAVPCGKCVVCLSNKRKDWSVRLMQEYKASESAHFVTLTYSEKFCPEGLIKRHVQLYLKRLRKRTPGIRYYAVGEYGSKTGRPHYHAIIFNSEEAAIRAAWTLKNPISRKEEAIGFVQVGTVTEASVSYVLKYVIQKNDYPDGLARPFAIMSRRYGLGLNYLTDSMVLWHREGERVYMNQYGEKKRLPRYYKDKIWPAGQYKTKPGEEKRYWSNWKQLRERINEKALKEAEQREEEVNKQLKEMGYKPEAIREEGLTLEMSQIKQKVSHSQKF